MKAGRKVGFQDPPGIITQLLQAEFVVGLDHHGQGFFQGGCALIRTDRRLRAIRCSQVSPALHVVASDVNFVLGQGIDDEVHANLGICRVLALGVLLNQLQEGLVRVLVGLLVTLGDLLAGEAPKQTQRIIEIHQAFEVERVVHRWAGWVQADKSVQRDQGCSALASLPVGVGQVQHGLLAHERSGGAGLDLLKRLDGLVPGGATHIGAGLCIQFFQGVHRIGLDDLLGGAAAQQGTHQAQQGQA